MLPLMAAGMAVNAAGGIFKAFGKIKEGKAQARQQKWMAGQAKKNELLKQWQARDALVRGDIDRAQLGIEAAAYKSKQRVGFAANGFMLSEGTPLQKIADTAMLANFDERTIAYNAEMEAWGFNMEASDYAAQAKIHMINAANARKQAALGAFTTLLGTAASIGLSAGSSGLFGGGGGGGGGAAFDPAASSYFDKIRAGS